MSAGIAGHAEAGTLHTGNGQALVEELYRLGAEADAHEMVVRGRCVTSSDVATQNMLGLSAKTGFGGLSDVAGSTL